MSTGHVITVEPVDLHVRAVHKGQVLAESHRPLVLRETGFPDRYYIPPEDVRIELLSPSSTSTHCPFKGDASYWSVQGAEDLVWGYPFPKAEVTQIKDHFCFYETEVLA